MENIPRVFDFSLWLKISLVAGVTQGCSSTALGLTEHTLLFDRTHFSFQAPHSQHTETGLLAQTEKASIWLHLLTEMLCQSLVPCLYTHTDSYATPFASAGSIWPSSLTSKGWVQGWMQPGQGRELLWFVICCGQYAYRLHWRLVPVWD